MENDDLVLGQSNITLNITECPAGRGVAVGEMLCSICDAGTFNLDNDVKRACSSCDSDKNPNVQCSDGKILISEGIWMGLDGERIISSVCPSSFCCHPTDGQYCDYIENQDSLCAKNRDSESFLCGKCIDGYSESMTSANCIKCDQRVHWSYLCVPLLLAATWTMYILSANRDGESAECSKVDGAKSQSDDIDIMLIMSTLISVSVYYQQALSQMLSESTATYWGIAFLGLFEVSAQRVATGTSSKGTEWCFANGLDAKSEVLLDLLTPFLVFLFMLIVFAFSRFVVRKPLNISKQPINFESAALAAYLLIIGKVLSTLFQLISCQPVGQHSVHFYFGYEHCYGPTWFISVFMLFIITLSFGAVFVYGARMAKNQQYDPKTLMFKLCKPYKPEYWYWEYVIFVRRIIIAYFAVSASGMVNESLFLSVVLLFSTTQWRLFPFVSNEANITEGVLLCGLMIVISSQILMESSDEMFFSVQLTAMVLLPFALLMYFVLRLLCKQYVYRFVIPQNVSLNAAGSRDISVGFLAVPLLVEDENVAQNEDVIASSDGVTEDDLQPVVE